ncbi:unnamed protein product, partial [Medioppia subpectinata]
MLSKINANTPGDNTVKSIMNIIRRKATTNGQVGHDLDYDDQAFYVVDVEDIINKHSQWTQCLPRVQPYYAVKCNPSPIVLEILAGLDCGFDCASRGELDQVLGLDVKVTPDHIIYANTCKPRSYILHARALGVRHMTFDNREELGKISRLHPDALLVIRVKVNDKLAKVPLGCKFGAHLYQVPGLLKTAKQLGLTVIGCSFHVGSGCQSALAYHQAISDARLVFDLANDHGYHMIYLNIGGGFPGSPASGVCFKEMAQAVEQALGKHFPATEHRYNRDNFTIVAELGRYYVASAFTLVTNIIAKRWAPVDNDHKNNAEMQYYLNDGLHGSFACIRLDDTIPEPQPLVSFPTRPVYESTLFGPTCDSRDCVRRRVPLTEMLVGEWLYFKHMGAYTLCARTEFNGFPAPRFEYT